MPKTLENILLFVMAALLQVFLFDHLELSIYIRPLVYIAFVVLLPMQTPHVWVLLSALALGLVVDVGSGTAGLNCAATLPVAFARPLLLRLGAGKDDIRDGGIPTMVRLGLGPFVRYAFAVVLMHSALYFCLEAGTWSYFYLTALRIVFSSLVTMGLVFVFQLFYVRR